uniref:EF-hand domain-containing protein n=1 Tax=Coccolithus braarudii TaxID=221442 RepID=A0A7S0LS14_9EUKA|mmetsp:Transcript_50707/g.108285  ORF Transcript_50707/g.108285 Transcript_50707/m.108285 type:complete len:162 (+) Transcript_50707:108-593(+)|eukprot:CAMPEP_0183335408 /NCGR_PEP_ID=MMETSP0164_2-20130417/3727_1 /TAXON_ID=221442 /ORGANISM="Coccolithus pelagicus ssp braarudi, Strain PLY182g" /LENGTH=161 /DNA_ID=CAMNT_0025504777 /DNA_START=107 /DNA_END=592 /DNA_ORIENTATION=+
MAEKKKGDSIEAKMDAAMLAELKEVFGLFDKNADGAISAEELGLVLSELNQNFKKDELVAMIKKVDKNDDGEIDFEEFLAMMQSGGSFENSSDELKEAFNVFDQDGDGEITSKELMHIFTMLGINITKEIVDYMMKSVDDNGDGVIDFEEFKQMMTDGPGS